MLIRTSRSQNWLPEVFNAMFDNNFMGRTATGTPAVNVIERNDEYSVELAAPGMTREDFHVTLDPTGEHLIVDLEKHNETTDEQATAETGRYLRHEFTACKYHQTFVLPDDVDRDSIKATAADGVLTVTLPKRGATEPQEARVIEIG